MKRVHRNINPRLSRSRREGRLIKLLKGKKEMCKSAQRDSHQERKRKVLEGLRGSPHTCNLVCISA